MSYQLRMDTISTDPEAPLPSSRHEQLSAYDVTFQMSTSRHETTIVQRGLRGRVEGFDATLYMVLQMPEGGGPALVELVTARSPYSELEAAFELVRKLRGRPLWEL